jgi:hypothetical protein
MKGTAGMNPKLRPLNCSPTVYCCGLVGLFESEEESEKARQEVKHPDSVHNFES